MAHSGDTATPRYLVPMLDHALSVLEAVGAHGSLDLKGIVRATGLSKTSVFRILATFAHRGYVRRDPLTARYALGPAVMTFAQRTQAPDELRNRARRHLEALRNETDETVNLAALIDGRAVYVDVCESLQRFRVTGEVGQSVPLHAAAVGKILLSELTGRAVTTLLGPGPYPALTRRTATSRRRLETALKAVRDSGFAMDDEEVEPGAVCVAAAVRDGAGNVRAALSVSGPSARMGPRLEIIKQALSRAAGALSLGHGQDARPGAAGSRRAGPLAHGDEHLTST